jgi:hypothetical protein
MRMTELVLYLGIFLIALSSAIQFYLYLRLRDIGKKHVTFNLLAVISPDYLRNRRPYGWPAWPVYLMWALLVRGLVVLAIGVSRL